MSESRAAYRYALALLGLAEELKQLDAVSRDFEFLAALVKQSREFFLFLKSPVVNKQKKRTVLTGIVKGRVSEMTSKFLGLITAKGRETILPEIILQFTALRDKRLGILNVDVKSAVSLTPEQERLLVAELSRATKKNIKLRQMKDASVIGGFTAQYEDTVWDASVRHQLELMRERLLEGSL